MSKSKIITASLIVAGVIIVWLLIEDKKKKAIILDLKREIDENENLTTEIKRLLKDLIDNNKEINPQTAFELSQIAKLIEIKEEITATMKLAKIIENLLKQLYKGDIDLKALAKSRGRIKPVFADYIEHAKNRGALSTEDYHLLSVMKSIRNDEAHEVGVKREKSRVLAAFICGMGLILALTNILKKKSVIDEDENVHEYATEV